MGDKKIQNMLDRYKLTAIVGEDTLIWIKSVYITNWGGSRKDNDYMEDCEKM